LVNKSLLHYDPHTGRYETHELLRHYAQEQLELLGQASIIYEKYAQHFANFMQDHWPQLKGHRQKIALLEIETDIENVRAAWNYWIKEKNITELRKFLHSFWVVYDIRGWYPAGIELFERGVEVMREIATEEAQAALGWLLAAQALYCITGGIYQIGGGMRKGFNLAQQGMQVIERLNRYDEMMIIPLMSMSITASLVNETDIAFAAGQEYLEVATQIEDGWGIAKAKQFLSIRAIKDSDYHSAELLTHEALNTFEENGDKWSESLLCIEVGSLLAIRLQQFDRAKEWIERGLKSADSIDFGYSRQMAYWQLGYVAALQENYVEAARYWQEAMKIGEDVVGLPIVIGFEGSGVEWS
jgi:tetratricopeptide (TPR) repeat protein